MGLQQFDFHFQAPVRNKPLTIEEELYVEGYCAIQPELQKMLNQAWGCDLQGRTRNANTKYTAAFYHMLLFYYALFIRNYLDRLGVLQQNCNSIFVEDRFKIKCVEENLRCLSSDLGTDFSSVLKDLFERFGIDRQTENCNECCVGISEMIIDDPDDCFAFILDTCAAVAPVDPPDPSGEFTPCEFNPSEFTEPTNPDLSLCNI